MATTLPIPSFADINIVERSALNEASAAAATGLVFASTDGFSADQPIFVGTPGIERCEAAVVDTVTDGTHLTIATGLGFAHSRFEPVIAVLGGSIRIYRAANVDGTAPADASFTVLATRTIDPDQQTTYYTDSDGSSDYWYKCTYYDATSGNETDLGDAVAVRGDDFAHYASLNEIRAKAGFTNAYNLADATIDQQRRIAEAEINSSLANVYNVPFGKPIPAEINAITIQLAAGLLLLDAYGEGSNKGKSMVKDARDQIKAMQDRTSQVTDDSGASLSTSTDVDSYPNSSEDEGGPDRAFTVDQVF